METKKILLIDDEPDVVKTIQVFLESEGYQVTTAFDGMRGLEKARSEKPDLIILDIMLPHLDGYNICAMLKFDAQYRTIPIVMFTACSQDDDQRTGEEVGADAYIVKPFDPEVLLVTIKELLR